ncbi:MAG: hypothetical protein A2651_00315 [Candidatus Yanofskybacteria bacterium RIFCSPHIGHO2_01_FULL_42_12]|uniref:Transketolase C-terminal domain-containing protein n=1 Tax=Candidatus Yanofskybacteria bacterium RIFCSPLOWO2_01_FULL_42_49 TaxID=1802694 RepID=A0A1F8GBP7_9BACT|nr:MAG: hypothetical protein A2651_00315 [Candidatus Yanofskybacteria bacterium RIFCSPHIGHO2_01_FULL_42_12]OGN22146.1 MAG: hypothetical protein A2918_03235 [Candidatus Yanofskybacteria bacterium RIFCSPLOWO2_01_FULL_42_49]
MLLIGRLNKINIRKAVFSLEEHSIYGGLGSAIAEVISEAGFEGKPPVFRMLDVKDKFTSVIGSVRTLRKDNNIDSDSIVKEILHLTT